MAAHNMRAQLRFQAQIKEMERKAVKIRMKCFERNYEKVYMHPSYPQDQVPKKAAKLYEEVKNMTKERFIRDKEERALHQRKVMAEPIPESKETDAKLKEMMERGPMYPVKAEVRELLYHGISHNDEGRKRYLKQRLKNSPDDKYYQPMSTTHDYGWKVGERFFPMKRYGRKAVIKQSFTRNNGALKIDSPLWRPVQSESLF